MTFRATYLNLAPVLRAPKQQEKTSSRLPGTRQSLRLYRIKLVGGRLRAGFVLGEKRAIPYLGPIEYGGNDVVREEVLITSFSGRT